MHRNDPTRYQALIVVIALAMAAMACNLGGGEDESGDGNPPRAATFPSSVASPTWPSGFPTPTNAALPNSTFIPATQANCTSQTTWPVYIVVAGDTLSDIAARANTTAEQLAAANCLTDTELIYIGQPLHVPMIPTTPTPVPTLANCTPRTDWPGYTVVPGDNLFSIAAATNSSVEELVQANCLANPGLLAIGQQLYVPFLEPTVAPSITPVDAPIFKTALTVEPHWLDSASLLVTYSDTVRINAGEVTNANYVTFYVDDPGGGSAIAIGQDLDPWDGAFVDYDFPAPGNYSFHAVAVNESAQANSATFTLRYDPTFIPPEGQYNVLNITPYVRFEPGWFTLQGGATVTVSWPHAPVGATQVDFVLTPTGTGMGDLGQVIGTDLTPTDGASIAWFVPGGVLAHVQGVATMPDSTTVTSEIVGVYAE